MKLNPCTPLSAVAKVFGVASLFLFAAVTVHAAKVPELKRASHDRDHPLPPVVTPGKVSTQERVGSAPSDAVVLFDGTDVGAWVDMNGNPTKWIVREGALECVPESGYIRTLQSFGDCQLHIEWATPTDSEGKSQGRGNSGVFFGLTRYEVQVLDSYKNATYADGSASSVYGQYAPLVNASKAPGEWQTYDILYTAPRFHADGSLKSTARLTVFHNGILTQNNVELTGPTAWIGRPPYDAHPVKMPIALQDHGNPVRYRNIWVRELGDMGRAQYMLASKVLEQYVGDYKLGWGEPAQVRQAGNGLLSLKMAGATLLMHAASETRFFSTNTDVEMDFSELKTKGHVKVSVGGDGGMQLPKL
jgi:hypothetical protein